MRTTPGRRAAAALLGAACVLPAAPPRAAATPERVVVSSKIDTEGALLGAMILFVLQAQGVPVADRLQLGPTRIVRAALLAGEVDIYPEYTGNGAFFFGMEGDPAWRSGEAAHATVARLDGMSAHADQAETLRWLRGFTKAPTTTYLVHGEIASMEALKTAIGSALGWHVEIPEMNETVQVLG